MKDSKEYKWGDLIVTVDYAKEFDYPSKVIVDKSNYIQTTTTNVPTVITIKDNSLNKEGLKV